MLSFRIIGEKYQSNHNRFIAGITFLYINGGDINWSHINSCTSVENYLYPIIESTCAMRDFSEKN
ncbi:hypothetical protein PPNK14_19010 [Pectobacterium parmentieri]